MVGGADAVPISVSEWSTFFVEAALPPLYCLSLKRKKTCLGIGRFFTVKAACCAVLLPGRELLGNLALCKSHIGWQAVFVGNLNFALN